MKEKILYPLGYVLFGFLWFHVGNLVLPLGGIVGAIRIFRFYKKDPSFNWIIRSVAMLIGFAIYFRSYLF